VREAVKRGLILTCGTSIIINVGDPPRNPDDKSASLQSALHKSWQRVADHYGHLLDEAGARDKDHVLTVEQFDLRPLEEAFFGAALRGDAAIADDRYDMALRALGVEAESLVRRIFGHGPPGPTGDRTKLRGEDRIGLLVSQTLEGVFSGLLIATVIGRGVRVWRSPRPTADLREPLFDVWSQVPVISGREADDDDGEAPVDVFIIDGLTVESLDDHPQELRNSAVALCQVLIQTVPVAADRIEGWSDVQDVEVELSGGYKATLPLMQSLLGYFGTFVGDELTVWLRHERAPDNWIPSALRRLPRHEVKQHLRELRQVRERSDMEPDTLRLHGFGWIDRRGLRLLTPEGEGILQLQRLT
jgi:hypothetical protein